jgi:single-strand DNA-binding protein
MKELIMNNLNLCVIEGNLTADPVIKYVKDGLALCKFSVAANKQFGSGNDARKEVTYINVNTWRNLAEVCSKYLSKGSHVLITGNIKQNRWEDKEGAKKSFLYVDGREVKFLSSGNKKLAA